MKSGQTDFAAVETISWSSENAQLRAEGILSSLYVGSNLDAWLCSNDSTAMGVMSAMEDWYAGRWPIITGQDCDINNYRELLINTGYYTEEDLTRD